MTLVQVIKINQQAMLVATEARSFLKKTYLEKIVPELMKSRGYTNRHQVPMVDKVVINSGFDAQVDRNFPEDLAKEIGLIAGQKAVITKASKSISNFKLREGMPIGVKVTLRGEKMYDFLYRFISVVLPLIRDFQGVKRKLDGNGNYTVGITDHTIFPEINSETSKRHIGMDVTMVTTATSDEEGLELLSLLGMPFMKPHKSTVEQESQTIN